MLANYFYFHFHFYAHSCPAALQVEQQSKEGWGAGERDTIDAVYGAIYDDSTFLFQPQWDRRNLNLLHIRCERVSEEGSGGKGIKTKHLRGGKNNAKTAENVRGRQAGSRRDKA